MDKENTAASIEEQQGESIHGPAAGDADTQDRRTEYERLIGQVYKDLYTEDTQKMINKRFRRTKELEETCRRQQEIIQALRCEAPTAEAPNADAPTAEAANAEAANTDAATADAPNTDAATADAADTAALNREELARELGEADADAAMQDAEFIRLTQRGVPPAAAWKVTHLEELEEKAMQAAREQLSQKLRQRSLRPSENGLTAAGGLLIRRDVSSLSPREREAAVQRSLKGERVCF